MAQKVEKNTRNKIKPWLEDKITTIRKITKPIASRASKWGVPSGVALIILITLIQLFLPKNDFQLTQKKLIKNPNDFEANLKLAEKFLENNQIDEAEKALFLAQQIKISEGKDNKILGETADSSLEKLWQKAHYSNPKDIRRLISAWEKIVRKKPNYRDGYLELAILHYKLYQDDKAREYLKKTIELDPNYEPARGLEKIIE